MALSDVRKLAFFAAVFTIGISAVAIYHFVVAGHHDVDVGKQQKEQLHQRRIETLPKSHTTIVEEESFDEKTKHEYDHKVQYLIHLTMR